VWNFNPTADHEDGDELLNNIQEKKKKRRRILDNQHPGKRTEEEEEGIRASEAIDRILSRLSNSEVVVKGVSRL